MVDITRHADQQLNAIPNDLQVEAPGDCVIFADSHAPIYIQFYRESLRKYTGARGTVFTAAGYTAGAREDPLGRRLFLRRRGAARVRSQIVGSEIEAPIFIANLA
jgi:hypothetical protein